MATGRRFKRVFPVVGLCTAIVIDVCVLIFVVTEADEDVFLPMAMGLPQYGTTICATSKPTKVLKARSRLDCVRACQVLGQSCGHVNFYPSTNDCEVFKYTPNVFGYKSGCVHLQRQKFQGLCDPLVPGPFQRVYFDACSYPFTYGGRLYYGPAENMANVTNDCDTHGCLLSNRTPAVTINPSPPRVAYESPSFNLTVPISFNITSTFLVPFVWIWYVVQAYNSKSPINWALSWSDYRDGFGNSASWNFWFGLEKLHLLTISDEYRLRIEIQQNGTEAWYSAEYWYFMVGDENSTQFTIDVAGYTGDAGNSMASGVPFSTTYKGKMPQYANISGGWWFADLLSFTCLTCNGSNALWGSLPNDEPHITQSRMMITKCRYN